MVHIQPETSELLVVGVMLEVSEYGHNVEVSLVQKATTSDLLVLP